MEARVASAEIRTRQPHTDAPGSIGVCRRSDFSALDVIDPLDHKGIKINRSTVTRSDLHLAELTGGLGSLHRLHLRGLCPYLLC